VEDEHALLLALDLRELFVAQKVRADLRDPRQLRIRRDNVAQQRLGSFDVDRKVVVDKENGDLAAIFFRALLQQRVEIVDLLIVGIVLRR